MEIALVVHPLATSALMESVFALQVLISTITTAKPVILDVQHVFQTLLAQYVKLLFNYLMDSAVLLHAVHAIGQVA
jgi:hypothetical protein